MSRLLGRLLLVTCLVLGATEEGHAQPISSSPPGGMKVQTVNNPLKNVVEWVVVVGMMGAGLFVVCRSSRRG